MGSYALEKLQLAQQVAFGTANTTATIVISGFTGVLKDTSEFKLTGLDDMNGLMVPDGRIIQVMEKGEITITGDLTFENAPYLLNAGVKAVTSGSVTGTTGKLYSFPAPTTTRLTPTFYTIQGGDDTQAFQMMDCICTDWEISAAIGGETTFSATFQGHTVTTTTFTSSVPLLGGTSIPAWLWKLYIDEPAGTYGTTAKTGILRSWSLKETTGRHLKQFQDGVITPSSWGQGKVATTLDYVLEKTAGVVTERGKWKSKTLRKVRLEAIGAQIGAGPATDKITIDSVIRYMGWGGDADADGNTTIDANATHIYDATDTTYLKIDVINGNATLT